jgi:hypothetical protein
MQNLSPRGKVKHDLRYYKKGKVRRMFDGGIVRNSARLIAKMGWTLRDFPYAILALQTKMKRRLECLRNMTV